VNVTDETVLASSVPSTTQRVLTMSLFGSDVVAVSDLGTPHVTCEGTVIVAVGGDPVALLEVSARRAVSVVVPVPHASVIVLLRLGSVNAAPFCVPFTTALFTWRRVCVTPATVARVFSTRPPCGNPRSVVPWRATPIVGCSRSIFTELNGMVTTLPSEHCADGVIEPVVDAASEPR
jgi:hypothetical protein